MDFEFTPDQLELRDAARSVLASACPPALVRAVHEHGDRSGPAGLWRTLCDLDWPGIAVPEACGGLGLGFLEAGIVVEELAAVVAPTPYLATVTQHAPALRLAGGERAAGGLAAIADGSVTGALAVAEGGRWELDAVHATARHESGGSWVLHGEKTHVMDGATADRLVIVARGEAGPGLFVVPSWSLSPTPVESIDPTMPIASVPLHGVVVAADDVLVEPGDPRAVDVVGRVLDEATAAIALSTVSACRVIFETTVQYAKDREQFGRAIGSFQALKHRLADCYLAVERASALGYYAALTIAEDDPRRSQAVSMAKAAAGDCQRLLTRDGLQLHGGIGFTWENDLHFWLKRAVAGELLFGTSAWHRARVARLMGLAAPAGVVS